MKRGSLTYRLDELPRIAQELMRLFPTVTLFGLTGSLGAGKTTLVQEILRQSGIEEVIQSPTFTYVSTYVGRDEYRYHHFDLYRLRNVSDFIEAGFVEYLHDPQAYVFIEWPEIIFSLLKQNACFISLEHINEETRLLKYESTAV